MQNIRPPKLNVNIDDLPVAKCTSCNSEVFVPALKIRVLSPLLSPNGLPGAVHAGTIICGHCGKEYNERDMQILLSSTTSKSKPEKPQNIFAAGYDKEDSDHYDMYDGPTLDLESLKYEPPEGEGDAYIFKFKGNDTEAIPIYKWSKITTEWIRIKEH